MNIPLLTSVAAPIIGPVDAPHLRYIPSYVNKQIPDKLKQLLPTIISKFHTARVKLYALLWFKPPVGIVGAWSFLRILEKVYGLYSPPPPTSGEEALADAEGRLFGAFKSLLPSAKSTSTFAPWGNIGKAYSASMQNQKMQKRLRKRKRKVRKGRSFDLDRGDRSYDNFGGIETVRVRACQGGLRSALAVTASAIGSSTLDGMTDDSTQKSTKLFGTKRNNGGSSDNGLTDESMVGYANDIETAIGALQISCPPKGSREYFVEQSAGALSDLSQYISSVATPKPNKQAPSIDEQNLLLLLKHSSKLIEMRTLDALLRTLRDRHLIVSARLRRTRDYWKWHVNLSGGRLGHLVQEIRQKVMTVLPWMGNDFRDRNQREYEFAAATLDRELEWLGRVERLLLERPEEMDVGDLLSVFGDDKNKQLSWWDSLVKNENGIDTHTKPSMSASVKFFLQGKNRMWNKQTEEWTKMARETIKNSLDETIGSSFTPIGKSEAAVEGDKGSEDTGETLVLYAESNFLRRWADYNDETADATSWLNVLSLVDSAALPKRAGERRYFNLAGLTNRIKQYDFLGIPSSALILVGANSLHDQVIEPNKQQIVDSFKSTYQTICGIWLFRFYAPMKGKIDAVVVVCM